jgi:hypothetical protein
MTKASKPENKMTVLECMTDILETVKLDALSSFVDYVNSITHYTEQLLAELEDAGINIHEPPTPEVYKKLEELESASNPKKKPFGDVMIGNTVISSSN